MAVGKRGVVFTLMAIVLVTFLLSSELLVKGTPTSVEADTAAASTRVSLMNTFSATFEEQVKHALATAGYFALNNLSLKTRLDGVFYAANLNDTLSDCIINNNIDILGTAEPCLHGNLRVHNATDTLILLAEEELGINVSYHLNEVWISEENPVEVVLWMNVSYNLTDAFARWTYPGVIIRTDVDLMGVEDPLHAFMVNTLVTNEPRSFALTTYRNSQFTPTIFDTFYDNREYIVLYEKSPSILQRYFGDYDKNSSCCGVESVIARSTITVAGNYENVSHADHAFLKYVQNPTDDEGCQESDFKTYNAPDGYVVFDAWRFDNTFNLSPAEPPCTW